ncbi:MAG TPA: glycerophosphodiester phosphodiesterase family protein [Verrucomicrobiae bacterium]|nr:glycerophosphodiester phosphodiesterase family protein [Verrucomicrobiae bacterium]
MRIKLLLIAVISAILTTVVAPAAQALPATGPWYQPKVGDQSPLVMAHQAGEGEYPSNSMLGFTQGYNAGADVLDTDMLATSDGVLVLYHDETLDFRSNCTGAISSLTYTYIAQNCNIGYDWTQDGGVTFPYRTSTDPNATKIVKASELLDAFPSARIGIEIKQTTTASATALCTLITSKSAQGRVLVSSGENGVPPNQHPNMSAFRTACPTVATSATGYETIEFINYLGNNNFPGGYNPPFSSIQPPMVLASAAFVAKAHQYQLKVYPWTIDTPAQALPLKDAGVDGINTSYPQRILNWMASQPLKYCTDGGQTYQLTNPVTSHPCVWVMKAWLNEARVKYGQTGNPAWQLLPSTLTYDTQMRDMVTVWQYISNSQPGGLPVTGIANPASISHMNNACLGAEVQYSYNSAIC